jgi:hypothetical protein
MGLAVIFAAPATYAVWLIRRRHRRQLIPKREEGIEDVIPETVIETETLTLVAPTVVLESEIARIATPLIFKELREL